MKLNKLEYIHYIILLVFSFFFMLFFTKSSPLFFLNDWVDANAYMTMGKGMVHGLVPFKDLFEQKGPLLYLIHAIAYLMSPGTFHGVYVFESAGLWVSLIFMYRIAHYFVPKWMALWGSFLLPVLLLAQPYFKMGDSAEEFTVPFMMSLIYTIFVFSREKEKEMKWYFFWQGSALGCVFWIKYTLIGAWIGFFLMIFCIYMYRRRFKEIARIIRYSLAGFAVAAIPWLVYFGMNHALKDLIDVYFVFNMFSYPSDYSVAEKCLSAVFIFATSFKEHVLLFCMLFLGIGIIILKDDIIPDMDSKLLLTAAFVCNGLAAFYGGKTYIYYYQILYPFTSIGLLLIVKALFRKKKKNPSLCSNVVMTGLMFCYSFVMTLSFNQTIEQSRFNTENPGIEIVEEGETGSGEKRPAQFIFADIMNELENPTMLNYGKIDMGFYTVADILPVNRYFEKPNISYENYPDIMDEQNQIVKDKAVDFIVLRGEYKKPLKSVATRDMINNYEVAASHNQQSERKECTYWLLQKKH